MHVIELSHPNSKHWSYWKCGNIFAYCFYLLAFFTCLTNLILRSWHLKMTSVKILGAITALKNYRSWKIFIELPPILPHPWLIWSANNDIILATMISIGLFGLVYAMKSSTLFGVVNLNSRLNDNFTLYYRVTLIEVLPLKLWENWSDCVFVGLHVTVSTMLLHMKCFAHLHVPDIYRCFTFRKMMHDCFTYICDRA